MTPGRYGETEGTKRSRWSLQFYAENMSYINIYIVTQVTINKAFPCVRVLVCEKRIITIDK